jgi:ABC-type lipoprotein export system ATPase subunit/RNA polymerase-binding transcription factor DksA
MFPKIDAHQFRSYPKIDWTIPPGLTLIDGENQDTGGSNMSGKTVLLDSLFWCRYGWLPKWGGPKGGTADAVIQRGKNSCRVTVTEQIGSDEIVIERMRPSSLRVWKNGEEQKSINQKELNVLLGMGPERFLLCAYIPQKRKNSFYHMGDRERTDLLSIISGLEQLDEGAVDAKAKKKVCEESITHFEGQKIAYNAQLNEIPTRVTAASKKKSDTSIKLTIIQKSLEIAIKERDNKIPVVQREVAGRVEKETIVYKEKLLFLAEEIKKLTHQKLDLKTRIDDTPKPEPQLYADVKYAEGEVLDAEQSYKDSQHIERENERYSKLIDQERAMAEAANLGKCDSCGQDLPVERRKFDYDLHMQKASDYNKKIQEVPARPNITSLRFKYNAAVEKLREREYELRKQPDEVKTQIQLLEERINAKKQEEISVNHIINGVRNKIRNECNERIRLLDDEVHQLESEMAYVNSVFNQAKENYESILSEQEGIKSRLFSIERRLTGQKEELNLALDLMDLFGPKGYRAVCFDGLVHRISERAGELLQIMTDGLYSTYLEQMGQDSKGNQKLILKPVVLKGSVEVPRDDLSGGAEDRIALAYDVAVSEAAGDDMPLLLDEALTALDAVGKTEAMAVLEEVSKSRPVLVIDHASEFKAMFTQVQRIVYKDGYSRLNDTIYNGDHESTG